LAIELVNGLADRLPVVGRLAVGQEEDDRPIIPFLVGGRLLDLAADRLAKHLEGGSERGPGADAQGGDADLAEVGQGQDLLGGGVVGDQAHLSGLEGVGVGA
jgi:hypothetical protein